MKDIAKNWGIMIDSDLSWKYHIYHYYYGFLFEGPETSAGQAIWQVLENDSFNWLTETIAHITKAFHWKQN